MPKFYVITFSLSILIGFLVATWFHPIREWVSGFDIDPLYKIIMLFALFILIYINEKSKYGIFERWIRKIYRKLKHR